LLELAELRLDAVESHCGGVLAQWPASAALAVDWSTSEWLIPASL